MESGEDWLLRPVVEGKCSYESLINGALDLVDVARLNDALDVCEENERRQRKLEHGRQ
jgi:hypothetical protein